MKESATLAETLKNRVHFIDNYSDSYETGNSTLINKQTDERFRTTIVNGIKVCHIKNFLIWVLSLESVHM